jgi:hypothetical protein
MEDQKELEANDVPRLLHLLPVHLACGRSDGSCRRVPRFLSSVTVMASFFNFSF